ncbi:MAG: hypothetical protein LQ351_007132 [Letrouitia transgressa]|nr:MAG: hypothetical protein LQ351_007132 [Letrouitia transgressa]
MSFDHILLPCAANLLSAELAFLNAALEPLGIKEQFRVVPEVVAFGNEQDKRFFWVSGFNRNNQPIKEGEASGIHIAFKAKDRAEIEAFYDAGIKAGGQDNGAPGPRKHYHGGYYGAFITSPAGNNVEAVMHDYSE